MSMNSIEGITGTLLLAALLTPSIADAQDANISKVELHQCGIYSNKFEVRQTDAASASGKHRLVGDNRLVQETREIPAKLGVSFGCQIMLRGSPTGARAEFIAVMRLPAGAPREELRGSQSYGIDQEGGYVGYTFRNAATRVGGTWILEIRVGDRKLADASFIVND